MGSIVITKSVNFNFGQFLFTCINPDSVPDDFIFEFIDIAGMRHVISDKNIDELGCFLAEIEEYFGMIRDEIHEIEECTEQEYL
jgi:hypothetical protein